MPNVFQITISATDKATAVVRKVNDSISRLTRPFNEVGKSFKSLGRELGFEKIGKNLGNIGKQATSAARGVSSIVPGIAAITGIASIAGIAALADNWGKLGRNITYSSQNIGMSVGGLQRWQGAAKLAGLSSDSMTASMENLGNTMQDAQFGRNATALMLFNKLGIRMRKTADGQWDSGGAMLGIADAVKRQKNPQAQKLLADSLGVGAMLPFLRMGSKGIQDYQKSAQQLGAVMTDAQVERADRFAMSLSRLQVAGEGLKNSVGNSLAIALGPSIDKLTGWIAANRELISQKIGDWAKGFADWVSKIPWSQVGNGITTFIQSLAWLFDKLGGIKGIAMIVGGYLGLSFVANIASATLSIVKLSAALGGAAGKFGLLKAGAVGAAGAAGWWIGSKMYQQADKDAGKRVPGEGGYASLLYDAYHPFNPATGHREFNFWKGVKSSDADIAANNQLEKAYIERGTPVGTKAPVDLTRRVMNYFKSKGWTANQAAGIAANLWKESHFNAAGSGDSGSAYGIGQWHADRQRAFAQWSGKSMAGSSLDDQMGFVNWELRNNERSAGDALRGAVGAGDAASVVSRLYERPADAAGEAAARAAAAEQFAAPQGPYSSGAPDDSTVHVKLDGSNMPAGLKVSTSSKGNVAMDSRIRYSTVGASLA